MGETIANEGSDGFVVELRRAGLALFVRGCETILEVLVASGVSVPHSCGGGTCGLCEVRVLEGIPLHRDRVLSREERMSNKTMMICCSGSRSHRLVLDL